MSLLDTFRFDHEMLLDVASRVQRLKMFPYFDIAHYILVSSYYSLSKECCNGELFEIFL